MFTLIDLRTVIKYLIVLRATTQFIGQNVGLMLLRKRQPDQPSFYHMWAYPLPRLVALAGWIFIFVTSRQAVLVGLLFLLTGIEAFLIHQRLRREWPFAAA